MRGGKGLAFAKLVQRRQLCSRIGTTTWDGEASQGQELTTGVRFYRIEAGNLIEFKKIILIK
jgi:hypothetical protein